MFHTKGIHELFHMPKKTIQSLLKMADMLHVDVEDAVILNDNHRLKMHRSFYSWSRTF